MLLHEYKDKHIDFLSAAQQTLFTKAASASNRDTV